ncbi:MAG: hypothetical protein Q9190_006995 [Brigantiaea leucoxantha]
MRTVLFAHAAAFIGFLFLELAHSSVIRPGPQRDIRTRDGISDSDDGLVTDGNDDFFTPFTEGNDTDRSSSAPGRVLQASQVAFHSSTQSVASTEGFKLYSLPINATVYRNVMQTAIDDLSSHQQTEQTSKYVSNSSSWSFSVIAVNTTITYGSIHSIAQHYLKLLPATTQGLVSTRVGTLNQDGSPIADVLLAPALEAPISNITIPQTPVTVDPTTGEITSTNILTDGTVTTEKQLFNTTAWTLAFANITKPNPEDLSKRADTDLVTWPYSEPTFVGLPGTSYGLNVHMWRDDPTGTIRQAPVLIFRAALRAALNNLVQDLDVRTQARRVFGSLEHDTDTDNDNSLFSLVTSDAVRVGLSSVVFQMMTSVLDATGQRMLRLEAKIWASLIWTLLAKLRSLDGDRLFPEMVADVVGPDPTTGVVGTIGGMVMVVSGIGEQVGVGGHDELRH